MALLSARLAAQVARRLPGPVSQVRIYINSLAITIRVVQKPVREIFCRILNLRRKSCDIINIGKMLQLLLIRNNQLFTTYSTPFWRLIRFLSNFAFDFVTFFCEFCLNIDYVTR